MGGQLTIDLNGLTKEQIGETGFTRADFDALAPQVKAAVGALNQAHARGTLEFMSLPGDTAAAKAVKDLAAALTREIDDLVVMGIGGSSLGPKALFTSLCHPFHNLLPKAKRGGARLFFPDNSDPSTFAGLLETLDVKRTGFAAITKSGGTAETWAQLLYVVNQLGAEAAKKQVVAVTDPDKGALRAVATSQGWRTLPVPPRVGGRFSVLTAVGLLPAAVAGIDIDELLAGAGAMARRCTSEALFENPAALFATALVLSDTKRDRRMHMLMPYADALRETGDWFVQLWAESLGKKKDGGHVGPTPLRAVGATDQHSILQLLMEGLADKVTCFVAVDTPRADLEIPGGFGDQPDVKYLSGHRFHALLNVEQRATQAALAANGRPTMTMRLPKVTPYALGELMMLLEVATGIAGTLYGVDAYDQPGVEAGKRYACGLLGRPGYEAAKQELEARPAPSPAWRI